ncbi:hypothetical protein SKAU_G00143640 [Synaphobranchus kaupii]|uniref:Uncharacterized protein n=1 Tax=Synaphobranchus kaupii TaxID=118154 RepID=A0A9Q1FSX2_SYNKA|nr:hypothetical protein SKAU_G00143640 [Synaphobranchus kaupii]
MAGAHLSVVSIPFREFKRTQRGSAADHPCHSSPRLYPLITPRQSARRRARAERKLPIYRPFQQSPQCHSPGLGLEPVVILSDARQRLAATLAGNERVGWMVGGMKGIRARAYYFALRSSEMLKSICEDVRMEIRVKGQGVRD